MLLFVTALFGIGVGLAGVSLLANVFSMRRSGTSHMIATIT